MNKKKVLIITTLGKNPGDEFIARGVINILLDIIGPDGWVYHLIDKENPDIFRVQHFDLAVWAGMPLFWSYKGNNFWDIPWFSALTGWLAENPQKLVILGAGGFQNPNNILEGVDVRNYKKYISKVVASSSIVSLRDNIPNQIAGADLKVIPCPAIFATDRVSVAEQSPKKVCNLMRVGGHYAEFNESESIIWQKDLPKIAKTLIERGFVFVAHTKAEAGFAKDIGWEPSNIICYSHKPFDGSILSIYAGCEVYLGCRIHGAISAGGAYAKSCCVGIDTRIEAVRTCGIDALLPSEFGLNLDKLVHGDIASSTVIDAKANAMVEYRRILKPILFANGFIS